MTTHRQVEAQPTAFPVPGQRNVMTFLGRPLRFAGVGLICAIVQVGSLVSLTAHSIPPLLANIVGFAVGSQLNFALHSLITWNDIRVHGIDLTRRWFRYMGTIISTAVVNQGLFLLLSWRMPIIGASLVASGSVSVLNYLLGNRFVFRVATHE